jgi:hypothetical protein
MKIIVLAGGRGTLLWPMSHELRSSQFLRLLGSSEPPIPKRIGVLAMVGRSAPVLCELFTTVGKTTRSGI